MDAKEIAIVKDACLVNIGKVIKKHRIKKNYTQEQLASALRINRSSIAKYESGETEIRVSVMACISIVLEFPLSEYMQDVEISEYGEKPIPLDNVLMSLME